MEAQDNNKGQVVEIVTGQSVQAERNRPLRTLQTLPQQAIAALVVFVCQLRATGESLESIATISAEKFNVHLSKAILSRKLRGDWNGEFEKQCGILDAQVGQHWIARAERRIAFYQRVAEKAEKEGDYKAAVRAAEMAAKEMDAIKAGGRSAESMQAEGLLKLAEAIKGMNAGEYERFMESLPAAAERPGALAVN